jgi:hypothetical protein
MSAFGPPTIRWDDGLDHLRLCDKLYRAKKLGGYHVEVAANSAGVGVHRNVRAGSRICTEAIVPRILREAMRRGGPQKLLHAELHFKVQYKAQREKIGEPSPRQFHRRSRSLASLYMWNEIADR